MRTRLTGIGIAIIAVLAIVVLSFGTIPTAQLDPSYTQNPQNPLEVTYVYSVKQATSGALAFYSDGLLKCSINVSAKTQSGQCTVTYSAYGKHTVDTIYSSGEASSTTGNETEEIEPTEPTTTVAEATKWKLETEGKEYCQVWYAAGGAEEEKTCETVGQEPRWQETTHDTTTVSATGELLETNGNFHSAYFIGGRRTGQIARNLRPGQVITIEAEFTGIEGEPFAHSRSQAVEVTAPTE